jgi:PAS domain S-box-containing protein
MRDRIEPLHSVAAIGLIKGVRRMNPRSRLGADGQYSAGEVLWQDSERVVYRSLRNGAGGDQFLVLALRPIAESTVDRLNRLTHEYGLRDELESSWAVRPLELVRDGEQTLLVLSDPGGEPLDRLIGPPMELGRFLRIGISLAVALGRLHERGLVHKDIKPTNVLVDPAGGDAWLTGFGIASRLSRERQPPEPPEFIAGTLAYMAPEQTGRMNRSIDSRTDLYSLGVTLYQMLTGSLPFAASDPMEWVHCHVARKPAPPSERLENVPALVSAIIMKLLAKTAGERYQTAAGLESDLRRCLAGWGTRCRIDEFPLGEHDTPDRLLIPEKLYGRDREIETLLTCFDRVVKSGRPELVLVSGYSGIGKSSVVNELHKALVPPGGLFASGKFDQYKRDIPYTTLAQAFQSLVGSLLSKSEAELGIWRDAFHEALGPNGLLMVDLVPQLKLIIGEQQPVPVLPSQDAQRRFQLVFRRFIGVFARPEHPLVLFLDDLQWLDAATLDFLEDLLTHADVGYLMLIGAYRDNEVPSTHPLIPKLETVRKAGAVVQEIVLAPLSCENIEQLLRDSFYCGPERAAPLAELIHDKTAGNPFFANQFIGSLAEESLLTFDYRERKWSWDLNRIHAKGYTDNVVDLMVRKLNCLPIETQKVLQLLACIGNDTEFELLQMISQDPVEETHGRLWEAVRTGLIFRTDHSYIFLHDRVREAAYSLVAEESRAEAHLRIGTLLMAHTPLEKREEAIFEIVNQLNRGAALITARDERQQMAEFNLVAAKRAKRSTAYASALNYLIAGSGALGDDSWERLHELRFQLEFHRAECEFLAGHSTAAEERLTRLSSRSANTVELATVASLRVDLYTSLDRSDRAVAVCLDYLRRLGVQWSPHPTKEEVEREYEQIWSQLEGREIEEVAELPLMSDRASLATLEVLTKVFPPALFTNANLLSLAVCRAVNLSLEWGNSDGSCVAYGWLGQLAGPRFGNYEAAFRFGRLGYELVEKRGLRRFQARTYMVFGSHVMPWAKHVRAGRDLLCRTFEAANKTGDLLFAVYSSINLSTNLLTAGDPLEEVQRQGENGLEFAQKTGFGFVIDHFTPRLAFIRTLRGLTPKFGSLDDGRFEELEFERHLTRDHVLPQPACFYWIRKLQVQFIAGEYACALDALSKARRLLWTAPSNLEVADYHLYGGLCHAASWGSASPDQKHRDLEALVAHFKQLELWAENCPENFENRAALLAAEIARIEGRELDAERLYEQAIRSAHENGFVHNEAVAKELAAGFYRGRGFDRIAHMYLHDARDCYLQWGADGKVRQLDKLFPQLGHEKPLPDPMSTALTSVERLDLATVTRLWQAISGEVSLEKLIETLMRTAIEHAGAERGLLILARGDEYRVVAEATSDGNMVAVGSRQAKVTAEDLPISVLHYIVRTKESVVQHDASSEKQFSADDYIRRHRARSILCVPLLKEARLVGVLYLENNLVQHVFTRDRIVVLKLLASEAAIALENIRLYDDLHDREAKIRRLVEANIIGIFIWCSDGRIIDANDAYLRLLGYDRDELIAGRLSWRDLTPPEWRDTDDRRVEQLEASGTAQPHEKEYLRKDGSRVPVLVGATAFEGKTDEGVGFVLDLTDQKRAEGAVRESEQRYREIQMKLAHANRVATMGQLSASIAHEINQPITGTITYADAALRWLSAQPPNLEEVRAALCLILESGIRAGDVISRIRALVKKAPPQKDRMKVNEVVLEVVALTSREITKSGISLQTRLSETLPAIQGDRVQLQQVILNLLINAIEAMRETSEGPWELLISTTKTDAEVLVTVQDSGPGLAVGGIEKLFEAFYTTKSTGLGMGLSICHSIIQAHRGRLWATSIAPRGAAFHFALPIDS